MKQCKFRLLIIITILSGLVFSSCDDDNEFWTTGLFDRKVTFYTDRDGLITDYFDVDDKDIYPDARFKSIEDINFDGNESIILTVKNRDIIDDLWLSVDGTNVKIYFDNLTQSREFYGGDVTHFVSVVIDQMRRYGYARIYVDAENYDLYNKIQLDIQLYADLKVYVRD